MHGSSLRLLLGVTALLAGCSHMYDVQYYSPSASQGRAVGNPHYYTWPGRPIPPVSLKFESPDAALTVYVEEDRVRSFFAGIACLPVLPVFLIGMWYPDSDWERLEITLVLRFDPWPDGKIDEGIDADLEQSVLILPGTQDPIRASAIESPLHSDSVRVTFEGIQKNEVETFELSLGEIRREGDPMPLPGIHFRKAKASACETHPDPSGLAEFAAWLLQLFPLILGA